MAPLKSCHHGSLSDDQNKNPGLRRGFVREHSYGPPDCPAVSSQGPAELVFRHNPFNVLSLASDAIADAAIGLDRHARDNGIDVGAEVVGTALRPLLLMTNIVILGKKVRHPIRPVGCLTCQCLPLLAGERG
jgi:hypothetical protein